MGAPPFLRTAPLANIRGQIAFVEIEGREICCMEFATLQTTYANIGEAIAAHLAHQSAQIVQLSKRGPLFLREDYREG